MMNPAKQEPVLCEICNYYFRFTANSCSNDEPMHPKAVMSGNASKLRKGAWGSDEDTLLRKCIEKYGEEKWHLVPQRAGLNRCRKSCRLRWLNYLRPNIRRGEFGEDEVDVMIRLHRLLGNRQAHSCRMN